MLRNFHWISFIFWKSITIAKKCIKNLFWKNQELQDLQEDFVASLPSIIIPESLTLELIVRHSFLITVKVIREVVSKSGMQVCHWFLIKGFIQKALIEITQWAGRWNRSRFSNWKFIRANMHNDMHNDRKHYMQKKKKNLYYLLRFYKGYKHEKYSPKMIFPEKKICINIKKRFTD